jgi:hypothetical protein
MFSKIIRRFQRSIGRLAWAVLPVEYLMKRNVETNFKTILDLVRTTRRWMPLELNSHRGSTMALVRKELRAMLLRSGIGMVDMYSKIRLEHYEHPDGSEHGYYEVVVRDDHGKWSVIPVMLMLHFTECEYYLCSASQVQGPVYKSSLFEA